MSQQKKVFSRRRVCRFCTDKDIVIDYKDSKSLKNFVTERGKIIPGGFTEPAPSINVN